MNEELNLDIAINMFKGYYSKAKSLKFVRKPMSYSIYQVWKYFNAREMPRDDKMNCEAENP